MDAGNMALEKVSVVVDLPNRDVNLDKLEADIGKALKKLVDLKPDEYYNLTYEKLPVTAKTLLVTAELGTEIATGEFTSYDQLKANTKENFKNLAKGGEYCITDMIAGAIKLPNMGAQLISSKHTKHMNQLQDIADCRGSLEDYADIKLEKIENAIHSIESAAVTAGADFINSSKEEKYQTLGYAGTTIAMFADAAFSLAEGIKAARAATKAAKAAEAIGEGGEVIAETAAESGEVLAGESGSAAYQGGINSYEEFNNATYFDKIDAIKSGDIESFNCILQKEGISKWDIDDFEELCDNYEAYIAIISKEVGNNIDCTYGIKGNAAKWGDMSGGAEQIVPPFDGGTLKKIGVLKEN